MNISAAAVCAGAGSPLAMPCSASLALTRKAAMTVCSWGCGLPVGGSAAKAACAASATAAPQLGHSNEPGDSNGDSDASIAVAAAPSAVHPAATAAPALPGASEAAAVHMLAHDAPGSSASISMAAASSVYKRVSAALATPAARRAGMARRRLQALLLANSDAAGCSCCQRHTAV